MQSNQQFFTCLALFFTLVALSESCFGDVNFVIANNHEIQLADADRAELSGIRAKLVGRPTGLLFESIDNATGTVILVGRPHEAGATLIGLIEYPDVAVNESRTFQPRIHCKGTLDPLTWNYCYDTSDTYLRVPELGSITVDHESISVQTVNKMREVIDASRFRSPSGELISSETIHRIQYIDSGSYYAVLGTTPNREQFNFKLQPVVEAGTETYKVSEWSCR